LVQTVTAHTRQEAVDDDAPPLVVHCSGDLGRSGSFTTVYGAYNAFLRGDLSTWTTEDRTRMCLLSLIASLRRQRHPWMVEGAEQYLICYRTIMELMKRECRGIAEEKDENKMLGK
jgi:protein tyrosine phosphatase